MNSNNWSRCQHVANGAVDQEENNRAFSGIYELRKEFLNCRIWQRMIPKAIGWTISSTGRQKKSSFITWLNYMPNWAHLLLPLLFSFSFFFLKFFTVLNIDLHPTALSLWTRSKQTMPLHSYYWLAASRTAVCWRCRTLCSKAVVTVPANIKSQTWSKILSYKSNLENGNFAVRCVQPLSSLK